MQKLQEIIRLELLQGSNINKMTFPSMIRFSPRQFTVRLGDYDLARTDDPSAPESYRVVKITAHPQFNGVGFYNDVALLELERDVQYSRFISPICLPTARSRFQTFEGTYPTVIGWGGS